MRGFRETTDGKGEELFSVVSVTCALGKQLLREHDELA